MARAPHTIAEMIEAGMRDGHEITTKKLHFAIGTADFGCLSCDIGESVRTRAVGAVGPKAVIVDDMLDTGETLVSSCERLLVTGVREIYICVTHGLFTGTSWPKLWSLGVKRIFCTDTIPLRAGVVSADITVLPVAPIIAKALLCLDKQTEALAAPIQ